MKTFDFLAVMAASCIFFASCGEKLPFVKRSLFEQSKTENAELKNSLQDLQSNFAKQNEDLASILGDLSAISRRTSQLQLNVENAVADVDTISLIHEDIEALKQRIDKLEKEADRARRLDKSLAVASATIKQLRQTVSLQEGQIAELRETIKAKDSTIRMQSSTISIQSDRINAQDETIASQEAELRKTIAKQVEMIYQAATELEDIADNGDFKVTGRKDKSSIKEYRKSIYQKAASYYEMASAQDCKEAQVSLQSLKSKIENLD